MTRWLRRRRGEQNEASCAEVAAVLQQFLDGQVDEVTTRRVRRHLDACRRCGLEAETYTAIKDALGRRRPSVDDDTVRRLREFGRALGEREAPGESDSSA